MRLVEPTGIAAISQPDDAELLAAFNDGDLSAASRLYERYARRLFAFARSRTPDTLSGQLDADDLVQSVFRSFFRCAREGAFDVPTGADLWPLLLTIALNKIRAYGAFHTAQKRDVRKTRSLVEDLDLRKVLQRLESRDPELFLHALAWELLERLPEHLRQVVRLRLDGHLVADIARMLDRTKRTVERQLQECRTWLSRILVEHSDDG